MKENESHYGKQHDPLINMILERYEKVRGELHNIEFMLLSNDDETIFTAMRRFGLLLIVYRDLVNAYEKDISIFSNESRKLLEEEKEITETMFAEIASYFLKRDKLPSVPFINEESTEKARDNLINTYQKLITSLSTKKFMKKSNTYDEEVTKNMIELGSIITSYKYLTDSFIKSKDWYSPDDFNRIFNLENTVRIMIIDILQQYLNIDLHEYMLNDQKRM